MATDGQVATVIDGGEYWDWEDLPSSGAVLPSSQQGGDYTFALTDASTVVEGTSADPQTFTIPPQSDVAFPYGPTNCTVIEVCQLGAGQITIAAGVGVTLLSDGGATLTNAQYATIGLRQSTENVWVLSGDLTT